jgi:putative phage-type endonuclease
MEHPEIYGHAHIHGAGWYLSPSERIALRYDRERGYIGASDAAALLGLSPYGSRWQLAASRKGLVPPLEATDPMAIGNLLEPHVRALAGRVLGAEVMPVDVLLQHPTVPRLRANLDGLARLPRPCPVELKWASWRAREDWIAWRDADPPWIPEAAIGTSPGAYYVQVQAQLAVTGHRGAYLVAVVGEEAGLRLVARAAAGRPLEPSELGRDELFVVAIPRDEQLIALLEAEAPAFWSRYVEGPELPEVEARDFESVCSAYQAAPGTRIELPEQLAESVARYVRAREDEGGAKRRKRLAGAEIMAAMGAAETATIGGSVVATWTQEARARVLRVRGE